MIARVLIKGGIRQITFKYLSTWGGRGGWVQITGDVWKLFSVKNPKINKRGGGLLFRTEEYLSQIVFLTFLSKKVLLRVFIYRVPSYVLHDRILSDRILSRVFSDRVFCWVLNDSVVSSVLGNSILFWVLCNKVFGVIGDKGRLYNSHWYTTATQRRDNIVVSLGCPTANIERCSDIDAITSK